MHNLFQDDAKTFHRTNVQYLAISYEEARAKMDNQYNSTTRQSLIRQYFHLDKLMEKESCHVNEGLEKLCCIVTNCTRQGPNSHRTPVEKD